MGRWQRFFLEDPNLALIRPSASAGYAAAHFLSHGKRRVLDLGCGAGRDTAVLAEHGLSVVGLDAARSGLVLARPRSQTPAHVFPLVEADARHPPFADGAFEGVYSFGLLHEFTGDAAEVDVRRVMSEVARILEPAGLLVVAVLAGDPAAGLPQVRLFSEAMFDAATACLRRIEKRILDDAGCTGRPDYRVWFGVYTKEGDQCE